MFKGGASCGIVEEDADAPLSKAECCLGEPECPFQFRREFARRGDGSLRAMTASTAPNVADWSDRAHDLEPSNSLSIVDNVYIS